MRTTLNLADRVVDEAKRQAAREGTSLTELIDRALRQYLATRHRPPEMFRLELETRDTRARPGVDIADRDALYDLMEGGR